MADACHIILLPTFSARQERWLENWAIFKNPGANNIRKYFLKFNSPNLKFTQNFKFAKLKFNMTDFSKIVSSGHSKN